MYFYIQLLTKTVFNRQVFKNSKVWVFIQAEAPGSNFGQTDRRDVALNSILWKLSHKVAQLWNTYVFTFELWNTVFPKC